MEDQVVSFETAKLAKEKGFDISTNKYWCNYYIDEPFNKWKLLPTEELSISFMEFAAPTQSLLQKWLREVHNLVITISLGLFSEKYSYELSHSDKVYGIEYINGTYEDALEKGLIEALKLIQ